MIDTDRLRTLIIEGERFLYRMNAIDAKQPGVRLNLEELRQWSSEAEAWASANGITLPNRGSNLDLRIGWESSAHAYVMRVLERLKECAGIQGPLTQWPTSQPASGSSTRTISSEGTPYTPQDWRAKLTIFFTKNLLGLIIFGIVVSFIAGLLILLLTR